MKTAKSFETLITHVTTRRHNPEGRDLHFY